MRHLFLIDPLEKLNIKKDSSLMLAHTIKESGDEVYLLFEKDFAFINHLKINVPVFSFNSSWDGESYYLKEFSLTNSKMITVDRECCLHMRFDPPFDARYLRYLWLLSFIEQKGVRVVNSAQGILKYNEKLTALAHPSSALSYVGGESEAFFTFIQLLKEKGFTDLILKPLDLFQGMGVTKISLNDPLLRDLFQQKVLEFKGVLVAQPFLKEVYQGEVRSIYFKGKELGSILKRPPEGAFLANIAQGAHYFPTTLSLQQRQACDEVAQQLLKEGIDWIAFDILGESLSEVNVTCPGLLVEVSNALKTNLALTLLEQF